MQRSGFKGPASALPLRSHLLGSCVHIAFGSQVGPSRLCWLWKEHLTAKPASRTRTVAKMALTTSRAVRNRPYGAKLEGKWNLRVEIGTDYETIIIPNGRSLSALRRIYLLSVALSAILVVLVFPEENPDGRILNRENLTLRWAQTQKCAVRNFWLM